MSTFFANMGLAVIEEKVMLVFAALSIEPPALGGIFSA
jgi:hypothetical protein